MVVSRVCAWPHLDDVAGVLAGRDGPTDRKSLLALRGVGPESEAESVRFHGRRVTKVGPEVKHGSEHGGPLNKGCERRTRALPDVSCGGVRCVVGAGVVEPPIEGRFARRVGAGMHAHPSCQKPEMAQDALDDILPRR